MARSVAGCHWGRLLVVVVAAALAVFAAGCGGGEGAERDPTVGTGMAVQGEEPNPPVGPAVAVQDDHLPGVELGQIPERLDLIDATGATTTRVDVFWWATAPQEPADPRDPRDPAYDFRRMDATLIGLAERNITPIVSVYSTPPWAAGGQAPEDPLNPVNNAPPDPEAFADFMAAVATRYSGDFTPEGAEEPLPEQTHWELWNEPNLRRFMERPGREPESSIAHYAAMVEAAYPAIKDANPDAVVIAGVAGPSGSTTRSSVGAVPWLEGLAEREIPLDAYSQHVYPAAAPELETPAVPSWSTLDVILEGIEAFDPELPLYITEAGYTTAETPFRDASATVTLEQQAEYLRAIWDLPQVQDPRVAAIVWFNLQDNVNWPAGLLFADGQRKPSYEAFVETVEEKGGGTPIVSR